jgi:MFS family permease
VGTALLALSALTEAGIGVVIVALVPLALGEAAFLPIATEAVVELTPVGHGGLAMALFSQCFAVSALVAPLVTGVLLDSQRNGLALWLLTALGCATCLLLLPAISRRAHRA